MTALLRTEGFARVKGCRRRSRRIAMVEARDVQIGEDGDIKG
jgi:hypothetical protein